MVLLTIGGYLLAIGIFFIQAAWYKRSLEQHRAANDKDRKEAAERYERLQKNSDQQNESLRQQIKRMEKGLNKDLKAFFEDLKKNLPTVLATAWKAEHPDRFVPKKVRELFTNIAERTSTVFANYDYTAKGGIKLGGAAGTICVGPDVDIPATAYIDRDDDPGK